MGVAGCGKTTLGRALANELRWRFIEGDDLHPAANVEKMRAGMPLTDADREPFLDAVADAIARERDTGVIAACSALKHSYRERLRARAGELMFVLPRLNRETLMKRLEQRDDHFMPASLLESQLATLEPPQAGETVIVVDGNAATQAQLACVIAALPGEAVHAAPANSAPNGARP